MTATATAPLTRAAEFLLVRLLAPTKAPAPPGRVREELGKLLPAPLAAEDWQSLLDGLASDGLLTTKPLRLTQEGKARALSVLGLTELPARATWRTLKANHLLPVALGVPEGAPQTRAKIGKADGLGAWLLKARHALPSGTATTLSAALEALACKQLGFPAETSLDAVRDEVLSRLLGAPERLTKEQLARQLAQAAAGSRGARLAELRDAALRGWLAGGEAAGRPTEAEDREREPFDLAAFAATVLAAARACATGRFGENKVFVWHVWRQLAGEPQFPIRSLDDFKRRLGEANNAGLLRLSRADLVQAMAPEDVERSETKWLDAVFHFVLIQGDSP
jgi:hypothetical protein